MKWIVPEDYTQKRMWNRMHKIEHSGFLFFPTVRAGKRGQDEWRWLEFAEWTERFYIDENGKKIWSIEFWSDWGRY